jgi:hypothetical protein
MMSHDDTSATERLTATIGVALATSLVVAQTGLYLINIHALDRDAALFDLEEGGLVTWATSSATFAVGLVSVLSGLIDRSGRRRGVALAIGTAFISFDDTVVLHERLGFEITGALGISDSYMRVAWPILYAPLLAVVAVLLVQLARDARGPYRLVLAGLIGLAAAVALEMAGVVLDRAGYDQGSWQWTVKAVLEEGSELASWILIATGLSVRLISRAGAVARDSYASTSSLPA